MGEKHFKNKSQVSKTTFLEKYGSLDLYDEYLENIFIIDHGQLQFDKTDGCTSIGIPEKEDRGLSDHGYFCIHDDLFDRIQSTHQDLFFWKFSFNEPNEDESQSEATETHNDKIQNKKRTANKYSTKHTLQRKRQKLVDYRNNSFDDFRLMIVDPHPELDSDESEFLSNCYIQSMKNQSNGDISKMVLTHILKLWDQNKTHMHPSSTAITSSEHICLKVCSIVLK